MTTGANEVTPARTFELACTDCSFESTVDGEFLDALDEAEEHQKTNGDGPIDHFVNVERNGHRTSG